MLPTAAAEPKHLQEMMINSWYTALATAVIDQYVLPAGRSAANQLHATAAADRRDRQTAGRTTVHLTVTNPAVYNTLACD